MVAFKKDMDEFITKITKNKIGVMRRENAKRKEGRSSGGRSAGASRVGVGEKRKAQEVAEEDDSDSDSGDYDSDESISASDDPGAPLGMTGKRRRGMQDADAEVRIAAISAEEQLQGRTKEDRDRHRATVEKLKSREQEALEAVKAFTRSTQAYFCCSKGEKAGPLPGGDGEDAGEDVVYRDEAGLYVRYMKAVAHVRNVEAKAKKTATTRKGKSTGINSTLFVWSWLADRGPGTQHPAPMPGNMSLSALQPMAKFVVALLQVPLSSAEDERVFSSAANIFTALRQRLRPQIGADMLVVRLYEKLTESGKVDDEFVSRMRDLRDRKSKDGTYWARNTKLPFFLRYTR